ncbi:MAG: PDZ domain-containing protein, partial [Acidimicrobiia bacterium]|nr:PDZ domain-containing protein [Acidimicrobiia bacterium]
AATAGLAAGVAFLLGLVVARSGAPAPAAAAPPPQPAVQVPAPAVLRPAVDVASGAASFADVAERLNPAVVNIDATSRREARSSRRDDTPLPDRPDLFDRRSERRPEEPRRGTGTGFVIDQEGFILTNHHVIEGADRVMVRLSSGRSLRADIIGSDPDTDVALIKVESPTPLVAAPLGDSSSLRVGEWVCAIGNPLAYEHTVTVGVVSFIGRKLFDSSLDDYIQTDAAINLGNSGGPLINRRGEVIGINAAISSRGNNIGFAVPINQARAILPQLREQGRVSRGYIGVTLKDMDDDLRRSLGLGIAHGAMVEDVTPGSPGWRVGVQTYDVIVGVDGAEVGDNEALIRDIAARQPGSLVRLQIVRDGRPMEMALKLAERPTRERRAQSADGESSPARAERRLTALGLLVRDMDGEFANRLSLPDDVRGPVVTRVEPMSPAFDAEIERGSVVLEVNRQEVRSVDEYRRLTDDARSGDVLALFMYDPQLRQRQVKVVRVDDH